MSSQAVMKLTIALQLKNEGFNLLGTVPNKKFPQYDVYVFEKTDALMERLEQLIQQNKEYNK